jgi:hypothetical protein
MNILAKSSYKPLTWSQILDGKKLKQRASHTSLPLSPWALQNERALPPLAKELAENSAPSSYI